MKVLITVVTGGGLVGPNLPNFMPRQPDVSSVRVIDDLSAGSRADLDGFDMELFERYIVDAAALGGDAIGVDSTATPAAICWADQHHALKQYAVQLVGSPEEGASDAIILAVSRMQFAETGQEAIRQIDWPQRHILKDLKCFLEMEESDLLL